MSAKRPAGFFGALVRRPVLLVTLFVTCIVIGLIAWARIPIQMMPEGIVEPGLEVFVTNIGASAQENEEQVARILEEELRTLPNVDGIESSSSQDSVGLFVEFKGETDMNFAKAELRDRVERARPKLPATVQDVGIYSWSQSDLPVMFFALLHPGDSPHTDFLVDNVIKRRIEAVDGVGKVEISGLRDDSMRIELDKDRVHAARLDLGALIRRLATDNFALPMGEVNDGGLRLLLRSDMRFRSPEEIEDYPIGQGLKIRDVGRVMPVKTIRESLFRIDGSYAYYVEVQKDGQANVVDTCHRVQSAMKELEGDAALAGEFHFVPIFNQGEFIRSSLKQLTDSAWEGGLLAVVILFLFLWRIRLTLLVALSIPISVLLAIAWVYFSGGTFNVLTMTGVTLAMGMLVDNAIVVIENITRLRRAGRNEREAVVEGTREVALAVTLSTLTTVVVFMPLIFMTENPILRLMFGELGLPLCVSLMISLVVALIFLPVAAERSLGSRPAWLEKVARALSPIGAIPARIFGLVFAALRIVLFVPLRALHAIEALALRVLTPLRWPLAAAILAIAAWKARSALPAFTAAGGAQAFRAVSEPIPLGANGWLVAIYGIPALAAALIVSFGLPRWRAKSGAPPPAPTGLVPAGRSIVGFVIDANHALVRWSMEHRVLASLLAIACALSVLIPINNMTVSAFGQEDSKSRLQVWIDLEDNFTLEQASAEMAKYESFARSRRDTYKFDRSGCRFTRQGGTLRFFWESAQTRAHMDDVLTDLRENLPRYPGHKLRFLDDIKSGDNKNRNVVTFRLQGPDSEELDRLGQKAIALLDGVSGLSSIHSPLESAPPQVRLVFNSETAQKLGVTPAAALSNISWALRGFQLPRYQEPGREIPLIIEYDGTDVAGLGTLRDLDVMTGASAVPLASFSDMQFGRGSRSIYRRNGQATFTIEARIDNPAQQKEFSEEGYRALAGLELPRGYSLGEEDSASTRQEEEFKELFSAMLLSVVLVFLLMGILFESFLLPISVLFTIPYAVVGSYWTLYVTGTAMDSVGWIGIIILVGVVVNNGIVLIDRIHGLRAEGWERKAAVLEGCANRVRPILMTALTSVIGLLPMAMTEPPGEAIDFRALATCVGGGLALSTIFTLWVVPLAYTLLDDVRHAFARWFGRRPEPAREAIAMASASTNG